MRSPCSWYETDSSNNYWQVSASILYPHDGSAAPVTNALQRTRLTGLGVNSEFGIQNSEFISQDLLGNQTLSRTFVDPATRTVTQTTTYPDSTNAAISVTINGLAQYSISKTGVRTDAGYDALGRQISATNPRTGVSTTHYNSLGQVDWVADALTNITRFSYCPTTGRRLAVTDALSNTTYTAYDPEGRVIATWGATYPVAYAYDAYGRMVVMATFRVEGGAGDQTQWRYDEATGLLTNKVYADGKGPSYTYTPAGQLATRTWARGVRTTYAYATDGAMTNIAYSDGTPAVCFTLDRLGQPITITDAIGTRAFAYNDALQLAAETNAFGTITRYYDSFGRSSGLAVGSAYQVGYGYSVDGRFSAITSSVQSVSSVVNYSYLPGTDLLSGWTSPSGFAVTRAFEAHRDLLIAVSNRYNGGTVSAFDYINDALARRVQRTDSGSATATNDFGYNPRSELTSAAMGTNAYGYTYDAIGNRQFATNNVEALTYTANALNQYTNITAGTVQVPQYDLDGNLTNYNGWTFAWDAENRLIKAVNGSTVVSNQYDYMSRRVAKTVGSTTHQFLYDDWNLARETTSTGVTNVYVWGLDLSGTLQGAGGIGGILSANLNGTHAFFFYDANGNVSDLTDASGTSLAHYEFDPYGNATVSSGSLASANTFRFSTKYADDEPELHYYGYRYYSSMLGGWINRDPIGEQDGPSVYLFVQNGPIDSQDSWGLWTFRVAYDHRFGAPESRYYLDLQASGVITDGNGVIRLAGGVGYRMFISELMGPQGTFIGVALSHAGIVQELRFGGQLSGELTCGCQQGQIHCDVTQFKARLQAQARIGFEEGRWRGLFLFTGGGEWDLLSGDASIIGSFGVRAQRRMFGDWIGFQYERSGNLGHLHLGGFGHLGFTLPGSCDCAPNNIDAGDQFRAMLASPGFGPR
jgi:RHS repeat-associated protein